MQTSRYWQMLLEKQIPEAYNYLVEADKIKSIDCKKSAASLRNFLESILGITLEYEGLVYNRTKISKEGMASAINKLYDSEIINENIKNNLDYVRKVGNNGSHPYGHVAPEELQLSFQYIKEHCSYFVKRYSQKLQLEAPIKSKALELKELQPNEIYVFECLKQECKREIKDKNKIRFCKRCGGPVEYKYIDANYIDYKQELITPVNIPSNNQSKLINKKLRYKFEIYDQNQELVREAIIDKDEFMIGRSSSSSNIIPNLDLKDLSIDKDGNCLISKEHALISKRGDDYYIENISKKSLLKVNYNSIEYKSESVKLSNQDVIILNNFIALMYIVY